MSQNKDFEPDTSSFLSEEDNPFAKKVKKKSHKTIRIYEDDYEVLKELAFYNKTTIVELVHEAVKLLPPQKKK
ncbi:hypothetical protein ACV242_005501 [Peribacillus simplex]